MDSVYQEEPQSELSFWLCVQLVYALVNHWRKTPVSSFYNGLRAALPSQKYKLIPHLHLF